MTTRRHTLLRAMALCLLLVPGVAWGAEPDAPADAHEGIDDETVPASGDDVEGADAATPETEAEREVDEAANCFPACRAGFVCDERRGECVSLCNPPCAEGERCAEGSCVASAPATSAPPATSATPTAPDTLPDHLAAERGDALSAWGPASNGVRQPVSRFLRPIGVPAGTLAFDTRFDIQILEDEVFDEETGEYESEIGLRQHTSLGYGVADSVELGARIFDALVLAPDVEFESPSLYLLAGLTPPGTLHAGVRVEMMLPFDELFLLQIGAPVRLGNENAQFLFEPRFVVGAPTEGDDDAFLNILFRYGAAFGTEDFYVLVRQEFVLVDVAADLESDEDMLFGMDFGFELGGTLALEGGNLDLYTGLTWPRFWNSYTEEVDTSEILVAIGARAHFGTR